jgi:carbon-monoxide dehydrogenase large subunit
MCGYVTQRPHHRRQPEEQHQQRSDHGLGAAMIRSIIGDRPKRREDLRFVTGRGSYLDDLAFERLAHAVVLRSSHAHAGIEPIDSQAARAMPGVLAVLPPRTGRADGTLTGARPLRGGQCSDRRTVRLLAPQPLLAEAKVRYVGEPVALIVAETALKR